MKNIVLIVFAVFLFIGCQGQSSDAGKVKNLEPKEFSKKVNETTNAQLIDVRTPEEYAGDRMENALNIDWNGSEFENKTATLDKSKPVFLYCRSGGRSAKAAAKLHDMGFTEIYNMEGGMMKWDAEGMPKAKN